MIFRPKFNRVQVFTRSDARKAALTAVSKLSLKQVTEMERELKITVASIKNLNPRMCQKVITWVDSTRKETEK